MSTFTKYFSYEIEKIANLTPDVRGGTDSLDIRLMSAAKTRRKAKKTTVTAPKPVQHSPVVSPASTGTAAPLQVPQVTHQAPTPVMRGSGEATRGAVSPGTTPAKKEDSMWTSDYNQEVTRTPEVKGMKLDDGSSREDDFRFKNVGDRMISPEYTIQGEGAAPAVRMNREEWMTQQKDLAKLQGEGGLMDPRYAPPPDDPAARGTAYTDTIDPVQGTAGNRYVLPDNEKALYDAWMEAGTPDFDPELLDPSSPGAGEGFLYPGTNKLTGGVYNDAFHQQGEFADLNPYGFSESELQSMDSLSKKMMGQSSTTRAAASRMEGANEMAGAILGSGSNSKGEDVFEMGDRRAIDATSSSITDDPVASVATDVFGNLVDKNLTDAGDPMGLTPQQAWAYQDLKDQHGDSMMHLAPLNIGGENLPIGLPVFTGAVFSGAQGIAARRGWNYDAPEDTGILGLGMSEPEKRVRKELGLKEDDALPADFYKKNKDGDQYINPDYLTDAELNAKVHQEQKARDYDLGTAKGWANRSRDVLDLASKVVGQGPLSDAHSPAYIAANMPAEPGAAEQAQEAFQKATGSTLKRGDPGYEEAYMKYKEDQLDKYIAEGGGYQSSGEALSGFSPTGSSATDDYLAVAMGQKAAPAVDTAWLRTKTEMPLKQRQEWARAYGMGPGDVDWPTE